jgi:hypothetical protein
MNLESKADRKRRLAAERQRRKRRRDAQRRAKCGSKSLTLDLFQATRAALEVICEQGGYSVPAEAVTIAIHGVAELAMRDKPRFAELMKTGSRK